MNLSLPFLLVVVLASQFTQLGIEEDRSLLDPSPKAYSDSEPSWSPDGLSILFTSNRESGGYRLFIVPAEGGEAQRLETGPSAAWSGSWSPDGSQIAFISDRSGHAQLHVMKADGSTVRQLTMGDHDGLGEKPSWSPDGSRIAFEWARHSHNTDIWSVEVDSLAVRRLTDHPAEDRSPHWSPDGSRIAFMSRRNGNPDLYMMSATGSGKSRLTSAKTLEWGPAWSPDGKEIVFWSGELPDFNLYTLEPAAKESWTRLTFRRDWNWSPAWSPDGSMIAFHSRHDGRQGVCVMKADGTGVRKITNLECSQFVSVVLRDGLEIALRRQAYSARVRPRATYVTNAEAQHLIRELLQRQRFEEAVRLAEWNLGRHLDSTYASDHYLAACRAAGIDAPASVAEIVNLFRHEKDEEALAAYAQSKHRFPAWSPLPDRWFQVVARERLGKGADKSCELICRLALDEYPESASSMALLSAALLGQRRVEEARQWAERALARQADNWRAVSVLDELNRRSDTLPTSDPKRGRIFFETSSPEWSWSPDGGSIVYDRTINGTTQIHVQDLDSGKIEVLISGDEVEGQPNWSPQGDAIAFVRRVADTKQIHLLNLNDRSIEAVTDLGQHCEYPCFSPRGRLAFVKTLKGNKRRRAVVLDLEAGTEKVVFDSPQGLNNLRWSPDGSSILLYSIDKDGWNDLYRARADGSGFDRLTDNTVTDSYSAADAPDGSRLLFSQGSEFSPYHRWFNYDVYESNVVTGAVRRMTWSWHGDDRGQYSPDGKTIGFVSRRSGYAEIFMMDSNGDNLRAITRQPDGELSTYIRRYGIKAGQHYFDRIRSQDPLAQLIGESAVAVLVNQLIASRDTEAAVTVAKIGVDSHIQSWRAQSALGHALTAAGQVESARLAIRRSLSIYPNQPTLVFLLGFRDFLEVLDSIERVYEHHGVPIFDLVLRLRLRGEFLSAITLLDRLNEAHPNDTSVLNRIAKTQMVLGNHAAAVGTYKRILALEADHESANFHIRRLQALTR